jgi:hypothetical protein
LEKRKRVAAVDLHFAGDDELGVEAVCKRSDVLSSSGFLSSKLIARKCDDFKRRTLCLEARVQLS